MKKIIFLFCLISLVSASCKKKCDRPSEDVNSGIIVPESFVKERSWDGRTVIRSGEDQVSFNKGYSYQQIDWDEYCVVSNPMEVNCNSQLE